MEEEEIDLKEPAGGRHQDKRMRGVLPSLTVKVKKPELSKYLITNSDTTVKRTREIRSSWRKSKEPQQSVF